MVGRTMSHDKILSEFGQGGMGIACKARAVLSACGFAERVDQAAGLGVGATDRGEMTLQRLRPLLAAGHCKLVVFRAGDPVS